MTILSKKKSTQAKPEETSDPATHHNDNHPANLGSVGTVQNAEGHSHECLTSTWSHQNSREEKRSSRSPSFEDYESGPSKRRLCSSPLRTVRSKYRDRNATSTASYSNNSSSVCMSPTAGPSRSSDHLEHSSTCSGYNSGDEYTACDGKAIPEGELLERDKRFEKTIRRKGFIIKRMEEDGACLFRAVADQVYGDQEMHNVVRKHCMDYIAANGDYFSHYVTEDFDSYINRKRCEYVHGNHIEMQAMSEMYNRRIEVYCYGPDPINIFHGKHQSDNEPIRLSYHRGSHYNSIVDPYKATIGVGLGLPSYTPGLAEKNLMTEAVNVSENFHIEQAMLEDKLRATDWEATNEAIEEQVARESYLQWLRENEKRNKKIPETSSSATVTSSELRSSPRIRSNFGPSSPERLEVADVQHTTPDNSEASGCSSSVECSSYDRTLSRQDFQLLETTSFLNHLAPEMFGLSDWEDTDILAQVIATSQQEYIEQLKKSRDSEGSSDTMQGKN